MNTVTFAEVAANLHCTAVTVDGRHLKNYGEYGTREEAFRIAQMWMDSGSYVTLTFDTHEVPMTLREAKALHEAMTAKSDGLTGEAYTAFAEAVEVAVNASPDSAFELTPALWHCGSCSKVILSRDGFDVEQEEGGWDVIGPCCETVPAEVDDTEAFGAVSIAGNCDFCNSEFRDDLVAELIDGIPAETFFYKVCPDCAAERAARVQVTSGSYAGYAVAPDGYAVEGTGAYPLGYRVWMVLFDGKKIGDLTVNIGRGSTWVAHVPNPHATSGNDLPWSIGAGYHNSVQDCVDAIVAVHRSRTIPAYAGCYCAGKGFRAIKVRGEEGADIGAMEACTCPVGVAWGEARIKCSDCGEPMTANPGEEFSCPACAARETAEAAPVSNASPQPGGYHVDCVHGVGVDKNCAECAAKNAAPAGPVAVEDLANVPGKRCPMCLGVGYDVMSGDDGPVQVQCGPCYGSGNVAIDAVTCPTCRDTGQRAGVRREDARRPDDFYCNCAIGRRLAASDYVDARESGYSREAQ